MLAPENWPLTMPILNGIGSPMSIGTALRKWREQRGISQEAFALSIGTTQPHLCEFERDKRHLSEAQALLAQRVTFGEFVASDLVIASKRERVKALDGSAKLQNEPQAADPGVVAAAIPSLPANGEREAV